MSSETRSAGLWDWLGDLGRILTAAADAKLAADAERERVRAEEAVRSAAALEKLRKPAP
jgi:hypothetical protein